MKLQKNKVTVILSTHRDHGQCNSENLLQLLTQVKPDVIFEELSEELHNKAFIEGESVCIESEAIRSYIKSNSAENIPVDTYPIPKSHNQNFNKILDYTFKGARRKSFDSRHLVDQIARYQFTHGFEYLNSAAHIQIMTARENLQNEIILSSNNETLIAQQSSVDKVIFMREEMMLDNIYSHLQHREGVNAIMLIGSAHCNTIRERIDARLKKDTGNINWVFYSDNELSNNS